MKKVLLALVATSLLAAPALADIKGSAHDFNGKAGITETRICVFCHTPHFAEWNDTSDPDAYYPLWNRMDSFESYTMYNSITLDSAVPTAPQGPSKLCLSCHDGSIAVDAYNTGGAGSTTVDDPGFLAGDLGLGLNLDDDVDVLTGIDMANDHPVSFDYTAIMAADGELRPLDDTTADSGVKVRDLLYMDKYVECSSCHDVHNKNNITQLLIIDDATDSNLCRTCHLK